MNFKTTLALLVLAAAAGYVWYRGIDLPPRLDPMPSRPAVTDLGTRAELNGLDPQKLTVIEVKNGDRKTTLKRAPGGDWTMEGNWPVRAAEARALAELIGALRSRFEPLPASTDKELASYGLLPPTMTVEAQASGRIWHMALGEPREDGSADRFSRPTYLRLGDLKEVVRVAPGIIAQLDKPSEYYQQRRLFDSLPVAKNEGSAEKVERLDARRITLEDHEKDKDDLDSSKKEKPAITLLRDGETWKIDKPVVDRLEARSRDALLSAVPDIWADHFVKEDTGAIAGVLACGAQPSLAGAISAAFWTTPQGLIVKSGLDDPRRVITVVRNDGEPVKLLIGRTAGSRSRKVLRPPPPGLPPGVGPREETVQDEYRYARLENNPQIFEVRADKLKDVFVALDSLREPNVAPFTTADARKVEITHGGEKIVLEKDKERWKLVEPVKADAESSKVTDLLSKLSGLQARDKDVLDNAKPSEYGLDKPAAVVSVIVDEETKDAKGEKTKKERTLTVKVGKHDASAKKLYVMADDWPRINAVDDSLDALVKRPALAYRGRRVLDFGASDLAKLEVKRGDEVYAFERTRDGWKMTQPVNAEADTLKVDQLAGSLGNLEATEFADEAPRDSELGPKYGLDKPAITVRLEFTEKSKPAQVLQVGKARSGKGGYFARLAGEKDKGTPVFVLPADVHTSLDRDSLAYRPSKLWQTLAEDITAVRFRRGAEDEYRLVRDGAGWKVAGALEAPALTTAVTNLVNELASPQTTTYKAHEAKDLASYGLDKPAVTVTVSTKDGKDHVLLVGAADKGGSGRYAKLANGPAVFVIGDTLARAADKPALDLLDPVLLRLDAPQLQRVQVKSPDGALALERKGDTWRVVEGPGSPFTADSEVVASLESTCGELRADRFAAFGKGVDWARYGLDKPTVVTLALKSTEKGRATHTIELGSPVPDSAGARYARVDKSAGVAILSPATAGTLARTHLDYVDRKILTFEPTAVQSLRRQAGGDILELVKKGSSWQIVKPADERADDRGMQALLTQLGELRAKRIAAYPASDPAAFGLDAPVAVVTIKLNGEGKPAEHVLKIGKTAEGGERFAQVDAGPAVAVLGADLANRLLGAPVTFRDRAIAQFADADKVRVERGPRKATFAKPDGTWKLVEPMEAEAEHDELEDFVGALAKLRADALVAERPLPDDLRKYGLDRPEVVYHLSSSDKDVFQLLVGNAEEGGSRRYARLAGRDLVFLLDSKLSSRAVGEFRPRTVWSPPADAFQVDAVHFGYSRGPFTLQKNDGAWQVVGKSGLKVNDATVNEYLSALAALKLDHYAIDKGADPRLFGLDEPFLTLEVTTRTGKRTLEIGSVEGESRRRYARVPGPGKSDVFVLSEADCVRLLRDAASFTKAPVMPPKPPPAPFPD